MKKTRRCKKQKRTAAGSPNDANDDALPDADEMQEEEHEEAIPSTRKKPRAARKRPQPEEDNVDEAG